MKRIETSITPLQILRKPLQMAPTPEFPGNLGWAMADSKELYESRFRCFLGQIQLSCGQDRDAQKSFRRAIELGCDNCIPYFERANARSDEIPKALRMQIADYTTVIQLQTKRYQSPDALGIGANGFMQRGHACFCLRQYENALKDHSQAIRRKWNQIRGGMDFGASSFLILAKGHAFRGNCYAQMGRFEDAIVELKEAMMNKPRHPEALGKSLQFFKRGISEELMQGYVQRKRKLEGSPHHPDILTPPELRPSLWRKNTNARFPAAIWPQPVRLDEIR